MTGRDHASKANRRTIRRRELRALAAARNAAGNREEGERESANRATTSRTGQSTTGATTQRSPWCREGQPSTSESVRGTTATRHRDATRESARHRPASGAPAPNEGGESAYRATTSNRKRLRDEGESACRATAGEKKRQRIEGESAGRATTFARRTEEERRAAAFARQRQREEEALWEARAARVREEGRRREAERRRVLEEARARRHREDVVREVARAAAPPARPYDPENAGLIEEGRWNLLDIRRGRSGTRDPRIRNASTRRIPLSLRLPGFYEDARYVLPPTNITRRTHPVVVDCYNSPARPRGVLVPPTSPLPSPKSLLGIEAPSSGSPRTAEEFRSASPALPSPGRIEEVHITRGTPRDEGSPDSDILLLAATETPERFSPSLLASPPRTSAPEGAVPFRRHLRF